MSDYEQTDKKYPHPLYAHYSPSRFAQKKKQRSLRRKPLLLRQPLRRQRLHQQQRLLRLKTTVAKSDAKDGEVAFERINGNNIT